MLALILMAILSLQCVTSQELDIVYNATVRQGDSWTLRYFVNTNGSNIQVSAPPNLFVQLLVTSITRCMNLNQLQANVYRVGTLSVCSEYHSQHN